MQVLGSRHQTARAAMAKGDHQTALALLRELVQQSPDAWLLHLDLGLEFRTIGYLQDAITSFRRAIALQPMRADLRCELIDVLKRLDRFGVIRTECQSLLACVADQKDALLPTALALEKFDQLDDALAALHRLIALDPGNFDAHQHLRRIQTNRVPPWHFAMMNDEPRNAAYEKALKRALSGKEHVFEIGTGSGVLSMLAARCGAQRVTTCEANLQIAAAARDIVKLNGFDRTITVIPRPSWELDLERDLGGRADLMVAEILGDALLDEDVLRLTQHARKNFLKPHARLIPCAVSAMARLVGGDELAATTMVETVSGFDLSPFNRFAPASISINSDSRTITSFSEDLEIFRFALDADPPAPEERRFTCRSIAGGRCIGVLQWMRLHMDEETVFENRPADRFGPSAWRQRLFVFAEPVTLSEGQEVSFRAAHNVSSLAFDRDGSA